MVRVQGRGGKLRAGRKLNLAVCVHIILMYFFLNTKFEASFDAKMVSTRNNNNRSYCVV